MLPDGGHRRRRFMGRNSSAAVLPRFSILLLLCFQSEVAKDHRDYSFEKSLQHEMSCGSMSLDVVR